jgi:hypothetical protein
LLVPDADAKLRLAAEAFIGMMARRATDRVVHRQPCIEVQLPTEFDLRTGQRILFYTDNAVLAVGHPERQYRIEFHMILRIRQPRLNVGLTQRSFAGNARQQIATSQ